MTSVFVRIFAHFVVVAVAVCSIGRAVLVVIMYALKFQACFRKARSGSSSDLNPHHVIDAVVRLLKLPQFLKDPVWRHRMLFNTDGHHGLQPPQPRSGLCAAASISTDDDGVQCLLTACAQYDGVTQSSESTSISAGARPSTDARLAFDGSHIHADLVACFLRVRVCALSARWCFDFNEPFNALFDSHCWVF